MIEKIFDSVITICEVAGTVIVFSSEDAPTAVKFLFWGLGTLAAFMLWIMFMSIFGGEK